MTAKPPLKYSSLKTRSSQKELMDDLSISFEEFKQTLSQIELINHLTCAYKPTIEVIEKIYFKYHQNKDRPLKILDIGSGYGDYLRVIYKWSQKHQIAIELTGLDLNPWSEKAASLLNPSLDHIKFITKNIFEFTPAKKYDICISSMFTHHLDDHDIVQLLHWMTVNSNYAWFINDLHRHPVSFHFIKYFTRFFGFNKLVKHDAPLSVARAFKYQDWRDLLKKAELYLNKSKISWHPSFRYCILYSQELADHS
jgi:2-polyprenyl-3-methyl-5-hydroxy-6-metoxy-1,4-benzoquinol methylase